MLVFLLLVSITQTTRLQRFKIIKECSCSICLLHGVKLSDKCLQCKLCHCFDCIFNYFLFDAKTKPDKIMPTETAARYARHVGFFQDFGTKLLGIAIFSEKFNRQKCIEPCRRLSKSNSKFSFEFAEKEVAPSF